jgi:hypothetical protein
MYTSIVYQTSFEIMCLNANDFKIGTHKCDVNVSICIYSRSLTSTCDGPSTQFMRQVKSREQHNYSVDARQEESRHPIHHPIPSRVGMFDVDCSQLAAFSAHKSCSGVNQTLVSKNTSGKTISTKTPETITTPISRNVDSPLTLRTYEKHHTYTSTLNGRQIKEFSESRHHMESPSLQCMDDTADRNRTDSSNQVEDLHVEHKPHESVQPCLYTRQHESVQPGLYTRQPECVQPGLYTRQPECVQPGLYTRQSGRPVSSYSGQSVQDGRLAAVRSIQDGRLDALLQGEPRRIDGYMGARTGTDSKVSSTRPGEPPAFMRLCVHDMTPHWVGFTQRETLARLYIIAMFTGIAVLGTVGGADSQEQVFFSLSLFFGVLVPVIVLHATALMNKVWALIPMIVCAMYTPVGVSLSIMHTTHIFISVAFISVGTSFFLAGGLGASRIVSGILLVGFILLCFGVDVDTPDRGDLIALVIVPGVQIIYVCLAGALSVISFPVCSSGHDG